MFKYIIFLFLGLIFISIIGYIIFGYFGGFQRPNDKNNISHLFVEKDGKVLMPSFEVELRLSEEDKQKLKDNGITISTKLDMTAPHKYVSYSMPGGVLLGRHKVEFNEENVAVFDDIWIPSRVFNRAKDYDFHVQVDFRASHDFTNEDLEDGWSSTIYIDFWESDISKAYGKRHVKKVSFKKTLSDISIEAFEHGKLYEYRHWKGGVKNAFIKGRKINEYLWNLQEYIGLGKEEYDEKVAKDLNIRLGEDCKKNNTKVTVNLLGEKSAQWFMEQGAFSLIHTNLVFENDLKNLEKMSMDFTLNKVEEKDQDLFAETYYEASKGDSQVELEGLSPQAFLEQDKKEFGEIWQDDLVHLVYHKEELIGVLNLRKEQNKRLNIQEGSINYIGLLPAHRNKGLGQQLHLFALHRLKNLACENYYGGTDAENVSMLRVFEKNKCRLIEKQGKYEVIV